MNGVYSSIGTRKHHFRRNKLLNAQHNPIFALDPNNSPAVIDGFGSILDLENTAIGGESGISSVVSSGSMYSWLRGKVSAS